MQQRIALLLDAFLQILDGLSRHSDGIDPLLPQPDEAPFLSHLERYEAALDALVCCWTGMRCLGGQAKPYGDGTATIWVQFGMQN